VVGVRLDAQAACVDEALAGVQAQHLADEELALRPEGERDGAAALEREGRLRDARDRDVDAGQER
jgi:hypothetical protein